MLNSGKDLKNLHINASMYRNNRLFCPCVHYKYEHISHGWIITHHSLS